MRAWRRTCTIETPAAACHRVLSVVASEATAVWTFDADVVDVLDPGPYRITEANVVDIVAIDGATITISYDNAITPGMDWIVDAGPGAVFSDGHPVCPGQTGLVT